MESLYRYEFDTEFFLVLKSMRGTMSSTDRWVMKINRLFMNAIGAHRSNTKNRLKNNAIELTVGLDMSLSRSMYSSCG